MVKSLVLLFIVDTYELYIGTITSRHSRGTLPITGVSNNYSIRNGQKTLRYLEQIDLKSAAKELLDEAAKKYQKKMRFQRSGLPKEFLETTQKSGTLRDQVIEASENNTFLHNL
jgi:hypothetical protein